MGRRPAGEARAAPQGGRGGPRRTHGPGHAAPGRAGSDELRRPRLTPAVPRGCVPAGVLGSDPITAPVMGSDPDMDRSQGARGSRDAMRSATRDATRASSTGHGGAPWRSVTGAGHDAGSRPSPTLPGRMHVIVIGGGLMGLATAYQLARDGQRRDRCSRRAPSATTRARRTGRRGSSGSRTSRRTTSRSRATSYGQWAELADDVGQQLLVPRGGLDFGPPDANYMAEMRAAMQLARRRRTTTSTPTRSAAASRSCGPTDDAVGFYQPDFAMLRADRCLGGARRAGARGRRRPPRGRHRDAASRRTATASPSPQARRRSPATPCVIANGSWIRPLLVDARPDARR